MKKIFTLILFLSLFNLGYAGTIDVEVTKWIPIYKKVKIRNVNETVIKKQFKTYKNCAYIATFDKDGKNSEKHDICIFSQIKKRFIRLNY
jgi:hypothetical protein